MEAARLVSKPRRLLCVIPIGFPPRSSVAWSLRGIKIGGRGDYRIGRDDLEAYIERTYAETEQWIKEHPFAEDAAYPVESKALLSSESAAQATGYKSHAQEP